MLRIFRLVALWEAISTLLLFAVAMPLKYFADIPQAVRLAGSIHGFLVVVFVILLIMCSMEYKWNLKRPVLYFLASLVPVLGFWIEKDVQKLSEYK